MTTRVWHETPQPWRLSEYRDYRPISSYAMIGDLHTAALVGLNGSIDWCCFPHFDSASVFAAILDSTRGGSFVIAPAVAHTSEQRYSPATNVLITTFSLDAGGVVELTDFMPITTSGHRGDFAEIHRRVRCTRGEAEIIVRFAPRFDYGEPMIRLQPRWNGVLATDAQDDVLTLAGPRDLWWRFDGGVAVAAIKLREGEQAWFVARYDDEEVRPIDHYQSETKLRDTTALWDSWTARIQYS